MTGRRGALVIASLFGLATLLASAFAWGQAGTLVFTSAAFSVDEQNGPGFAVVSVQRVGGTTGAISTTFTTSDGSATAPADYQAQNVTLTFLDGAVGPATISIPVVKDSVIENNETFDVHLTGGAAGALNQATVTILESPGTLQFSSPTYSINENGVGFVTISVIRVGGTDDTISTTFTTSDGSATAPADYQAQNLTLTFLAGAVGPASITIPIVNDSVIENNETFDVHLTGGQAGALNQATVTILESPGTLQFSSPTYSINENGVGFVTISVIRVGGTDDTISTTFTTSDGSATAPADYQAQNLTLTFLAGAVGPASITIPIVNDGIVEGNETFTVHLTGGQAGALNQATVTIVDAVADLALTKTAAPNAVAGALLPYTLTLANNGILDAQTVALTDPLPPGTTFVSLAQNTGPAFACATPPVGTNGTITCNIATLAAGASATFTLIVQVSPGFAGTLNNTANATSVTIEGALGNNVSSAATSVGAPLPVPTLSPWALLLLVALMAGTFVLASKLARRGPRTGPPFRE